MQAVRLALAAGVAAAFMTGCGTHANPTAAVRGAAITEAQATKTLLDGFGNVYEAAFQKLDANADGNIDEYEAGPFIDLRDYQKADENKDHSLTKKEFTTYGTREGLFGWCHQTKDQFLKQQRNQLLKAFDKLDANKDHLLSPEELGAAAVTAQKLTLELPGLKTKVGLKDFNEEDFKAADHTGDALLGQAEFEDYALSGFIHQINPKFSPAPPAPPAPDPAPPAPQPAPGSY
jgi:Ca2+-binding EF-hand superfamily protein